MSSNYRRRGSLVGLPGRGRPIRFGLAGTAASIRAAGREIPNPKRKRRIEEEEDEEEEEEWEEEEQEEEEEEEVEAFLASSSTSNATAPPPPPPPCKQAIVPKKTYKCRHCDREFGSSQAIAAHYRVHRKLPDSVHVAIGTSSSRVRRRILKEQSEKMDLEYKKAGWARHRAQIEAAGSTTKSLLLGPSISATQAEASGSSPKSLQWPSNSPPKAWQLYLAAQAAAVGANNRSLPGPSNSATQAGGSNSATQAGDSNSAAQAGGSNSAGEGRRNNQPPENRAASGITIGGGRQVVLALPAQVPGVPIRKPRKPRGPNKNPRKSQGDSGRGTQEEQQAIVCFAEPGPNGPNKQPLKDQAKEDGGSGVTTEVGPIGPGIAAGSSEVLLLEGPPPGFEDVGRGGYSSDPRSPNYWKTSGPVVRTVGRGGLLVRRAPVVIIID